MSKIQIDDLSSFARSAFSLDSQFSELRRLSDALEHLEINSDAGLERARLLLGETGTCGEQIGAQMQALATNLEQARADAEVALQKVAARAVAVQERQLEVNRVQTRLNGLQEVVAKINTSVAELQAPASQARLDSSRGLLNERLPEIESHLASLIEEAQTIRNDAGAARMKTLEREAHALGQALTSIQSKIGRMSATLQ